MKLKPVVASLFVLGLISGPALAAKAANEHYVQNAIVEQNAVTSPVCTDNWFNRISIGGIAAFVADWGNTDPAGTLFPTDHSTDLFVNNANLLVNANINCWTKATLNLVYIGHTMHYFMPSFYNISSSVNPETKVTTINVAWIAEREQSNKVRADEAYVTFSDFNRTPFYAQVGKMYLKFGDYVDPYNFVLTPLTQKLSQINQTAALVGVATDFGLYANAYAFRGNSQPAEASAGNIRNFGAKVGFYDNLRYFNCKDAHYNLNLGWVRSMQDGDYWSPAFFKFTDPVGGISAHGDLSWNQFDLSANFVGALNSVKLGPNVPGVFAVIPGMQSVINTFVNSVFSDSNTKIWAADVNADYVFKTLDRDSRIGLSYQFSGNGQFMADTFNTEFPKTRIEADYKINILKNTDLTLSVAHNKSYDFPSLGQIVVPETIVTPEFIVNTGGLPHGQETSNVVLGKLSIQF